MDRCKDDAKQQILVNENLAKNESETCVENAKKTIHNNFGFIATLISVYIQLYRSYHQLIVSNNEILIVDLISALHRLHRHYHRSWTMSS